MNLLSREQREYVVDLWRQGEQTQVQIAELLGITQGNVSKILARARRRDPQLPKRRPILGDRFEQPRFFTASQLGSQSEPMSIDRL